MSKYTILTLSILLLSLKMFAQLDAGPNDTVNPGVPVTLTATYGMIGEGVTIADDGVEGPFPIGFNFSFFGNIYDEFYIGANGWISFSPNPNAAGTREAFPVPSAADYNPKNCIMGPFQDMNPLQAGSPYIFYKTLGADSNRTLVVMWCQTPMFSCEDSLATFQIILHEGTNRIENQILKKPSCAGWLGNKATLGVQNITGYVGFSVPGHNATSWTSYQEAWQYSPTSIDSFQIFPIGYSIKPIVPGEKITYSWYRGTELIASTQSVTVAPGETTEYTAVCTLCDGQEFRDNVTVVVVPYIPNAFTPNNDGLNDQFRILGLPPENITLFNLQIYNRWGQSVFQTSDVSIGWDGTLNGEPCPEGVYVWVIYYEDNSKRQTSNKGTILLLK